MENRYNCRRARSPHGGISCSFGSQRALGSGHLEQSRRLQRNVLRSRGISLRSTIFCLDAWDHLTPPAPSSHWVLMTRDVIPGSRIKKRPKLQALAYSEIQALVTST